MKTLSKLWFRILMGFVGGFVMAEVRHIITGRADTNTIFVFIIAAFIFFILSVIVWIYNWTQAKKLGRMSDDEILDN